LLNNPIEPPPVKKKKKKKKKEEEEEEEERIRPPPDQPIWGWLYGVVRPPFLFLNRPPPLVWFGHPFLSFIFLFFLKNKG
jgi:hypothetical protein